MSTAPARAPDSITAADVDDARDRLRGVVPRTPVLKLDDTGAGEIWLKLESLQPIRSFKLRGAYNAIAQMSEADLAEGVYTASAGNMAQGVAWAARQRGARCTAVVPDSAPAVKLDGIRRLGAEIVTVTYDQWWQVFTARRFAPLEPARFIHPVSDIAVMSGNGTIGLEILEDVPDVEAVLVPFGGGGLSCGIAAAIHGARPEVPVYACEVETAAPFAAALTEGRPVPVNRTPTFVDGIGAREVLPEMWAAAHRLLRGSIVVSLEEVTAAIRFLVERSALVAEGAGGAAMAAGLKQAGSLGRVVCVISGGNLDPSVLARILDGEQP
jgi:threonine dehydratase